MLTGDHLKSAQVIQKQLSIEKVIAGVLPHEKELEIRKLQEQGKKVTVVLNALRLRSGIKNKQKTV